MPLSCCTTSRWGPATYLRVRGEEYPYTGVDHKAATAITFPVTPELEPKTIREMAIKTS